jgi:hypothetical protein
MFGPPAVPASSEFSGKIRHQHDFETIIDEIISHRIVAGSGNLCWPGYNFFATSAVVRRSKSLELGHIRLMA